MMSFKEKVIFWITEACVVIGFFLAGYFFFSGNWVIVLACYLVAGYGLGELYDYASTFNIKPVWYRWMKK